MEASYNITVLSFGNISRFVVNEKYAQYAAYDTIYVKKKSVCVIL